MTTPKAIQVPVAGNITFLVVTYLTVPKSK